ITPSEPGSTFKLVSLMALMEDNKISLNNMVDLEKGTWHVANQSVHDSEKHNRNEVTVKQAFELSSNVGMSKLIYQNYANNPTQFFNRLNAFRIDSLTGIDLVGERRPTLIKPGNKLYGPTTLPWVAFGYNLLISPLQTLMIYNAVANNGKLLKPYLVSQVLEEGEIVRNIHPTIYKEKICSDNTIAQLKECLEGVCINGTGKELFKNTPYKVAGKTGTALIANGKKGYAEHIYQSSFAGYFPADDPTYTCIVVIKNKPNAQIFYGSAVAGPVFKAISNKLYYKNLFHTTAIENKIFTKDSTIKNYILNKKDAETIAATLGIKLIDSTYNKTNEQQFVHVTTPTNIMWNKAYNTDLVPDLKGLTLKDALYICEKIGLIVVTNGNGRVKNQSIEAGKKPLLGQHILLELK
ncbi:MAG: penicillin-binding transpeptidase domain-containing protein, partial [Sediminibacterium sp.]|nr:penicillin-binding transpeptidase domain-containing protein [Sediminibacterium sp.]